MPSNNFVYSASGQQQFDVDRTLFDVSNRMAQTKLSRHTSNASSTLRPRGDRVSKPASACSSPQRRRTVNSYRQSRFRPDIGPEAALQSRGSASNCGSYRPKTVPRPVSWHPSTYVHPLPMSRAQSYYAPSRYSTTDYQSQAGDELHTPSMPAVVDNLLIEQYFNLNGLSSMGCQPTPVHTHHQNVEYSTFDTTYHTYFDPYTQDNAQQQLLDYQGISPCTMATQSWTESLDTFPSYTTPPTPDLFLPIQNPGNQVGVDEERWGNKPSIERKKSTELVGMGLYDDAPKQGNSYLAVDHGYLNGPEAHGERHDGRVGKGLKLEETWQPPEEEDDSSDDDEADGNGETEDEKEERHMERVEKHNEIPPAVRQQQYGDSVPLTAGYGLGDIAHLNQAMPTFDSLWGYANQYPYGYYPAPNDTAPVMSSNMAGASIQGYTWP
ncbi:hypothetical protein MMC25_008011 [Agyrium rufum]|nr:hypothetical protein [Agyrium rufum]